MRQVALRWINAITDFLLRRRLLIVALLVILSWAFFWSLFWVASLLG